MAGRSGLVGGYGSGGLGVSWSVRAGGGAGEGDVEAEGFDLADVVGDLAAGCGLPFVVVRAKVLIAHAGVGQQLVVDLQLGVAEGDLGFALAAASGQLAVAGALAGGGLAGGRGRRACRTGDPAGFSRPRRTGARRWGTWSCRRRSRRRRPGRSAAPSRAWILPAAAVPRRGPAAARSPRSARRSRR